MFVIGFATWLCFVGSTWVEGTETRVLSAVRRGPWQHHIVEGLHPEADITARFNDSIEQTGWSFLEIHDTRQNGTTDREIAYLAGTLEANLTASLIQKQWQNTMSTYCTDSPGVCDKIQGFLLKNDQFMSSDNTDPLWYQAQLFEMQVSGLRDGYQQLGLEQLPDYAFEFLQLHGDLDDLEAALGGTNTSSHSHSRRVIGSGSCSALVKVLPGATDLLVGHNTWTSYINMIRIFKLYDLKYQISGQDTTVIPGHTQVFPSYPGRLYSGDDYYLISSGLLSMETSIENTDPSRWKYVTPECILENVRVIISNRLASSGKEWTNYFKQYNSGTYNNQWMIVDYKLFTPRGKLMDNLLWVLEQMPGYMEAADMTNMLRSHSYWASYNIPYFHDVFVMSGTEALVQKYGDWFTWEGCPRAKIFNRNHTYVKDISSLIDLMQYNNFQHDNLSVCVCTPPYSGENGIAARSDLNPPSGTYPFSALGHRLHGAIDMKVTSSELFQSLSCHASSGPTSAQQPPFQWSTSGNPSGIPPGHPNKWDFSPLLVKWATT